MRDHMTTKCVYAGSFDPPTNGHMWMMREGSRIFDSLIVTIGQNSEKHYTFSLEERMAMLKDLAGGMDNVSVDHYDNMFLVDYARAHGAGFILRSIRDTKDYEYEKGIRNINEDIDRDVITVFLIPPSNIGAISSSLVKGLVGSEGWEKVVSKYVSAYTLKLMEKKYAEDRRRGVAPDIGND